MEFLMGILVLFSVKLPTICAFRYGPLNKAVLAGTDVVMNCGSNGSISRQWKFKQINGEEVTLSDELNVSTYYSYAKLNTSMQLQYDLYLSAAERRDVGIYSCILEEESMANNTSNTTSQTKRYDAYLVILYSEPNCSVNVSGHSAQYTVTQNDIIEAQCNVAYSSVRNGLRMKWTPEDLSIINATTTVSGKPERYSFRSSITFPVAAETNRLVLSCFTYFTEINESISSDPLLVKATNAPDYNHTCIITLNVQYNPRNLTIQRQYEDTAGLANCYRCYADGNPPPECDWTVTAKERTSSHSGCVLCLPDNSSLDWEIMVACEATNIIGKNITTIKVNFTANSSGPVTGAINSDNQIAGVVSAATVGLVSVVIIIIMIIIYSLRRRHTRTKQTASGEMSSTESDNCQLTSQANYLGPIYDVAQIDDNHGNENRLKYQTVGADGTVYTVLCSSNGDQTPSPVQNDRLKPLYVKSNYMEISHNYQIPPPPPKLNFE